MESENSKWNYYWEGPTGRAVTTAIEKHCLDCRVKSALTDFFMADDSPWESNPIDELDTFLIQLTAVIEDIRGD